MQQWWSPEQLPSCKATTVVLYLSLNNGLWKAGNSSCGVRLEGTGERQVIAELRVQTPPSSVVGQDRAQKQDEQWRCRGGGAMGPTGV